MIYSEILKQPKITEALTKAGVQDVPSPIMNEGDFSLNVDESNIDDFANRVIDMEIIGRRNYVEYQKKMKEHEVRMKPYKDQDDRINAARPHVEKLLNGRIADDYRSVENGIISVISEAVAKLHDFSTYSGEIKEDNNGLSELDRILKQARVTRLDQKKTPDDVILKYVVNSPFVKFLK